MWTAGQEGLPQLGKQSPGSHCTPRPRGPGQCLLHFPPRCLPARSASGGTNSLRSPGPRTCPPEHPAWVTVLLCSRLRNGGWRYLPPRSLGRLNWIRRPKHYPCRSPIQGGPPLPLGQRNFQCPFWSRHPLVVQPLLTHLQRQGAHYLSSQPAALHTVLTKRGAFHNPVLPVTCKV